MSTVKCILGTVVLFTLSVWTDAGVVRNSRDPQHEMTVSERLELVNKDLSGDILTGYGAFGRVRRNADPCVQSSCKWPRSIDGWVYVPYIIDNSYSDSSKRVIELAMGKFSQSTCIRFTPRTYERDYVHIQSRETWGGCRSYVGRQGGAQVMELKEPDCIYNGAIQHELLHALGFHHEHSRSDRDNYIRVLLHNVDNRIVKIKEKYNTLNQGTLYDYNSIMQYGRFTGSKKPHLPTLEAKPSWVPFGGAMEMSQSDIYRVYRLYCT